MEFLQPLNPQQEKELLEKSHQGDKESKDRLIEHNMRLVAFISKKFTLPNMDPEDVISIGTIGLIKAVQSFDIGKNNKFATYASRCITNEILMYLRKNKHKTQDKYLDELVSCDSNGHELSLIETLEGTKKEEIEKKIELKEDIQILYSIMGELNQKEKTIIEYRFGINCDKKRQEEIAEEFQISQSYVSRIETKALKKLRERYEKVVS